MIMKKRLLSDQIVDAIVLGKRIYGNAAGLSRASGVSAINISRWGNRQQIPKVSQVEGLLALVGARLVLPDEKMVDYEFVPKVVAKAGAGASLETDGNVEGLYAFRRDFLCTKHISIGNSVLMGVVGDSMEPLFSDGDTILVDKSDVDVRDGHIYVVTLGDELRVKRIHKGLNGLILRSENPRYPDIDVEGPDLETFVIHGRVRWCGKVFA